MSKARDTLAKERGYILWLFGGRCVRCGDFALTIHEIIPISHGNSSFRHQNRIPLCAPCHAWAHGIGTNNSILILQKKRLEFLIRHLELDTVSDEQNGEKIKEGEIL